MADIAHSLMIKYGLPSNPSQAQIDLWLVRVQANIAAGMGKEAAGESAARATFIGFRTRVYASQADTLEMLLAEAGRKK